jgi:uncharacterized protein (DUF433 family)
MTIAPDTPTDIARRQQDLITEARGYTARHLKPPVPVATGSVWDLPDPQAGWRDRAACWADDPELFPSTTSRARTRRALATCGTCLVSDDCRTDAVRWDDQCTVRGAMTPAQRNRWLAKQGIARPSSPSPAVQRGETTPTGRRIPLDVARIVELRQGGATFPEIAADLQCTERTAQRRYVEWERQQAGGGA